MLKKLSITVASALQLRLVGIDIGKISVVYWLCGLYNNYHIGIDIGKISVVYWWEKGVSEPSIGIDIGRILV